MNREDIEQWTREAGGFDATPEFLAKFANLVASAERAECKKLCTWKTGNQFVDEAVAVCYRAIDQRGQA
jgi:hypothetical protein